MVRASFFLLATLAAWFIPSSPGCAPRAPRFNRAPRFLFEMEAEFFDTLLPPHHFVAFGGLGPRVGDGPASPARRATDGPRTQTAGCFVSLNFIKSSNAIPPSQGNRRNPLPVPNIIFHASDLYCRVTTTTPSLFRQYPIVVAAGASTMLLRSATVVVAGSERVASD